MTNILTCLPDFDLRPYTHILSSIEKASISCGDILTLDASDVAKRAQVPIVEVKRLSAALLDELSSENEEPKRESCSISALDDGLDFALAGALRGGSLTELVGESAAGKTQFLLTLLLSVQLLEGGKSGLYISTEAPLQTGRLASIMAANPKISNLEKNQPSLSRIHSTHIHDLEAQDHILRFQVPVIIKRHNIGLLVVDSIAANYRPEFDKGKARKTAAESFVKRSNQVTQLGALLRGIAQTHNIAVVVANQVADRFAPIEPPSQAISQQTQRSTNGNVSPETSINPLSTDDPLALDHQQRFFTGWGDELQVNSLKTPSLGLAWANQVSTRIALLKDPQRRFRIVFSSYCSESSTDFEITDGGLKSLCARETQGEDGI